MLYQLVLIIHTIVAIAIIALVFLQHGKGADIGAAFGSGASNTVFGSQGSGGVLYKATCFLAVVFCVTSISLTAILSKDRKQALQISDTEISVPVKESPNTNSTVPTTDVPLVNETDSSSSSNGTEKN